MAELLMHGTLDATIFEATDLTNPTRLNGNAPEGVRKGWRRGSGLGKARLGRTRVIDDEPVNPRWNERLHIYCAHFAENVVFSVKVSLSFDAALIGCAYLPVKGLLSGQVVERKLDILDERKKKLPHGPTIHVWLQLKDVAADGNGKWWGIGVGDEGYSGVPCTYFKQHTGCKVTLYQDAFAPRIPLAGGAHYQQGRCWEDRPGGELLKRKASEGVRVLMKIWNDITSLQVLQSLGITWGYSLTHDAETFQYFEGTDVHCVVCARHPDAGSSIVMGVKIEGPVAWDVLYNFEQRWRPDGIKPEDIEAVNLIPRELSLKIKSKIDAGERFTVYVVVPMWPEGYPDSQAMQAILDWQRRTMQMMYDDIAGALKEKKMDADPRDYLTFFCLGNKEVKRSGEYVPTHHPREGTQYTKAQKARRFMIYVYSKMMYIIVGSVNINQLSMDGGRDSEIAMGAFQPHHLNINGQVARGQVHAFRMSLWYEHLGGILHDDFLHPGSLECVRRVNKMAG
uniref:C2 domain-containing protein n=1 Tax=Oryza coarctata TaxID=77588 RepID=C0JAA8_ORYCO|nr:unknown [Oryza coarctata]